MPELPDRRPLGSRLAGGVLLALLAGAAALALGPRDPGAIRVGGVSLLWWYGAAAAPVASALVALAAFRPPRDPAERERRR